MKTVASKDGTTIAYDQVGKGPAVILVGGALQYRSFDTRTADLADLLAKAGFSVYHYDRRGRGDSTDTQPYAKEREVEDLAAILKAAGGSAMVYAMSSGGALALEAIGQALNFTKLALYEPTFIVDDSRPGVPANYAEQLQKLGATDRGAAVEYFLVQAVGIPAEYMDGMRQDPSWADMEAVAHTLAYDGVLMQELMQGKPLPERWRKINIPALVVDGGNSPDRVHHTADALAATLPQAKRRTLEGQDHGVDPNAIAPILIEFFKG